MEQGHQGQVSMSREMTRRHYWMLGANVILSTLIMYLVMFEMIYGWSEFIQNINFFYMAVTMSMPMGVLMLLMMGSMYPERRLNLLLYVVMALIFILAFA